METQDSQQNSGSKIATWTNVVAWIVAALMTFMFFGTLENGRGDGFGYIGFMMVGLIGIAVVFFVGFLPSLVRRARHPGDPDYHRGFIVDCVVLGVLVGEFVFICSQ